VSKLPDIRADRVEDLTNAINTQDLQCGKEMPFAVAKLLNKQSSINSYDDLITILEQEEFSCAPTMVTLLQKEKGW